MPCSCNMHTLSPDNQERRASMLVQLAAELPASRVAYELRWCWLACSQAGSSETSHISDLTAI